MAAAFPATVAPVTAPRWELSVAVDDLDGLLSRVPAGGPGHTTRSREDDRWLHRLHSPDGLSFRWHPLGT